MTAIRNVYEAKHVDQRALGERLATVRSLATGFATGQARAVLRALEPRCAERPLTLYAGLLVEPYAFLRDPHVRYVSGFFGPVERMAREAGLAVDFLPADFHGFERLTRQLAPQAIAAVVSPPDGDGWCSFGAHAAATARPFVEACADPDRLAIAEINPRMPRVAGLEEHGGNRVHVSQVDVIVEDTTPLVTLPWIEPTDVERRIAGFVAELVEPGATLQFGIGGIPNAVAEILASSPYGDYGVHTEMLSDGTKKLHDAGKVVNRKGLFDGVSVATFALGSDELYRWLDGNPLVRMLPVGVVNDPACMARTRNFTSINAALAVDRHGQVVADAIGGRQYSGIGGHETFTMGGRQAPGGKSILCLRATVTVGGESRSTIVPELPAGTIVTTPRHQVQYVVTEWGAADLDDKTDAERVKALAAIADPEFRAALRSS